MQKPPVLTKKQQKSSLSAKKTKTKETIRNVLATPFSKYWPLIPAEDIKPLHDVLSEYLPRILREKVKTPWDQIKTVPRSERKLCRKEYIKNQISDFKQIGATEKEGLIFGVNDTTKGIDQGIVKSILIAEDVQPKLMVEHLIDQSVLFRIPVLVVPELRDVLKSSCGLSSIAFAISNSTKYETVQKTVETLYKKHPVPRNHINFQRSLNLVNGPLIIIDDSVMEDSITEDNFKINANCTINADCSNADKHIHKNNENIEDSDVESEPTGVYLYRKKKDQRMFIPRKSSDKLKNNSQMQSDSSGFLSFSVVSTPTAVKKNYKSLQVKKIKGDANRNKRKINEMKLKTKQRGNKKLKPNNG